MKKAKFPLAARGALLVAAAMSAGIIGCGDSQSIVSPGADGSADVNVDDIGDVPSQDGESDVTDASDVTQPLDVADAADAGDAAADAGADAADAADASDALLTDVSVDIAPDVPTVALTPRAVAECGTVCERPLDAVPNAAGTIVFFTAFAPDGTAGVFRAMVPAAGAMPSVPTLVASGNGLEFPLGIAISNDDNTLYIADQSASRTATSDDGRGGIFSVPAAGGTPTAIALPPEFVNPAGISVSPDGNDLLITGQQTTATSVLRVALRMARAGGTPAVLTSNLIDPSGISQSSTGTIIIHDTRRGGSRQGSAVTLNVATVSEAATLLVAGYPAGLSYAMDGRSLLSAGADPANGGGLLTWVGIDGRPLAPTSLSAGMEAPQGLHRARTGDVWAVADESAGTNGRVFLVTR